MFSIPIVFIVGAGANAEFGMPTGAKLKEEIAKTLNFRRDQNGQLLGDRSLYELLGNRFRNPPDAYYNGGIQLSDLVGQFNSIDEALHWFSSRPEVVSLGKACIVRAILAAESRSSLFNPKNPDLAKNIVYAEAWAPEFLSMAVGSLKREEVQAAFLGSQSLTSTTTEQSSIFCFPNSKQNFCFPATKQNKQCQI